MDGSEKMEKLIMKYSNQDAEYIRDMVGSEDIMNTARLIMSQNRGTVLIATGVLAGEHMEIDGPVGAYFLAGTLRAFGFRPVMITDECAAGIFLEHETRVMKNDASMPEYEALLNEMNPVACISVRRCGITESGVYRNDAGFVLKAPGARLDRIFELAHMKNILTVAVCRSAYETGIGRISEKLHRHMDIDPCVVHCDELIVSSMANWGAYALTAAMMKLAGLRGFITAEEAEKYADFLASRGCVDDLYTDTESDILKALAQRVQNEMSPRMRRTMGWALMTS